MATESQPSLTQTAWDRARHDTIDATKTLRFWLFDAVLGIAVAAASLLALLAWGQQNVWILAGVPPAVGIIWLLAGMLFILAWHLFWAPYRQRDDVRSALQEMVAPKPFPDVEIEKHSMEQRTMTDGVGTPTLLFILRRVRITNRGTEKVSLGFGLNVRVRDTIHTGLPNVLGQLNISPGPFGVPPLPWLQGPLDLEPKSSVLGNLAFALSLFDPEEDEQGKEPQQPPDVELEVSDYLSGTSVRLSPGLGYPEPSLARRNEVASGEAGRRVSHGNL